MRETQLMAATRSQSCRILDNSESFLCEKASLSTESILRNLGISKTTLDHSAFGIPFSTSRTFWCIVRLYAR